MAKTQHGKNSSSSSNNNNNSSSNNNTSSAKNKAGRNLSDSSMSESENKMNESSATTSQSISTSTTQPETTGTNDPPMTPCEPGTHVTLEGIVWHETDSGMLVVNVTWRNKTYIGTLLDSTKYTWSAPRLNDNENENDSKNGSRGSRNKRTSRSLLSSNSTTERKTRRSQMAAQAAHEANLAAKERNKRKTTNSKNAKKAKKEQAAAAAQEEEDKKKEAVEEEQHSTSTSKSTSKGGKGSKNQDKEKDAAQEMATSDADNTGNNKQPASKKAKLQGQHGRVVTPVTKDEDYHPTGKKRYKGSSKYTEDDVPDQPAKKRKSQKGDSKADLKKSKGRSATPTTQSERNASYETEGARAQGSPTTFSGSSGRSVPTMPHLSYNGAGSGSSGQKHKNQSGHGLSGKHPGGHGHHSNRGSSSSQHPPTLHRGGVAEDEDAMDIDELEMAKPSIPSSRKGQSSQGKHDTNKGQNIDNNSPGKRISPAYSDISDANEDSNSPTPNTNIGPPPKLVSRPTLPNAAVAQPQAVKPKNGKDKGGGRDGQSSPSSTRLPAGHSNNEKSKNLSTTVVGTSGHHDNVQHHHKLPATVGKNATNYSTYTTKLHERKNMVNGNDKNDSLEKDIVHNSSMPPPKESSSHQMKPHYHSQHKSVHGHHAQSSIPSPHPVSTSATVMSTPESAVAAAAAVVKAANQQTVHVNSSINQSSNTQSSNSSQSPSNNMVHSQSHTSQVHNLQYSAAQHAAAVAHQQAQHYQRQHTQSTHHYNSTAAAAAVALQHQSYRSSLTQQPQASAAMAAAQRGGYDVGNVMRNILPKR